MDQSWFRRHRPWLITVFAGYGVALALAAAAGVCAQWVNLTAAYFVAANLIVLWWYADTTKQLLDSSRKQVDIGQAQYEQTLRADRIAHKPFVVVERIQKDVATFSYYIRNIGPGLAVNVSLVQEQTDGRPRWQSLGSLAAGGSRMLYGPLERDLRDKDGVFPFALFAEGLVTRTTQWTATANVRERVRGTEMRNQVLPVLLTDKPRTIEQCLAEDWSDIRKALQDSTGGSNAKPGAGDSSTSFNSQSTLEVRAR